MRKLRSLSLVAGLALTAGMSLAGSAVAAETHSNCIQFDDNGNVIGLTPSCSQTIADAGGESQSFPGVNPCTGDAGMLTMTAGREVYHINVDGASDAWDTGTTTGTLTFTPSDSSQPSGSGKFTNWFGDGFNAQNMVQTFTFAATVRFSNGQLAQIHEVGHITLTPGGAKLAFDKPSTSCTQPA